MGTIGEVSSTPAIQRIELSRWLQPVALAGALLALLVLTISPAPEGSVMPSATAVGLEALPLAARPLVSRTLGRDQASYAIHRGASRLVARNAVQGLLARFGPQGVQIRSGSDTLGLRLRAVGRGQALRPVRAAVPTRHANRVSYRRGPLTEWYANGPLGLEQGFTLRSPPTGVRSGPLTFALSLTGDLSASLKRGGRSLAFLNSSLRYAGLVASDARGRELPATLELHERTLRILVHDAGARYPVTVDPYVQQAKLTPSDGSSVESVAISGDSIVAGAGGAVYVFVKPSTGWATATQTAKLTASNGDGLGSPPGAIAPNRWVAISGNTIVAGAPSADADRGAAYVFVEPAGGWTNATETAKLTASDADSRGGFLGASVAISGNTIVAGAPFAHSPDTDYGGGAAYVFVKPAGGWAIGTETAELTPSDTNCCSGPMKFAASVAIDGDTIAVGAPGKEWVPQGGDRNYFQGAVYVFVKPAGGWVNRTQNAEMSSGDDYSAVGSSVAISGDTIVAGAPGSSTYTGSVDVFVKPPTGWADGGASFILTASDGTAYDYLGWSVTIVGDSIVAGAPTFVDSPNGAVYLFGKTAWGGWSDTQKLTDPDGPAANRFGAAVALGNVIVVGAGSERVFADAPAVISVTKQLRPTSDSGRFDLKVAGTVVKAGAGDGGSGSLGVDPGTYRVAETAGGGTSPSDYSTSIACTLNGNPGPAADGTTHLDVTVAAGDSLACTITNRRKATVTMTKRLLPSSASGRFDLKLTSSTGARLVRAGAGDGDSGTIQVAPGPWTVLESAASGTTLSDYVGSVACTLNGKPGSSANGTSLPVQLAPADVLACTFTNRQTAAVTLTKALAPSSDPGRFDLRVGQSVVKAAAGNGGSGSIQLLPGTYRVTESPVSGTSLSNYATSIACTLNGGPGPSASGTTQLTVTLAANDQLACTLTNKRKAQITLIKHLEPSSDLGRFDLRVGQTVLKTSAGDGDSGLTTVGAATYTLSEVAAAGTTLSDYTSSIACTRNGGPGPSGTGTSRKVSVNWGDVLVCTFTNQRK
jgi:hypothetical protein